MVPRQREGSPLTLAKGDVLFDSPRGNIPTRKTLHRLASSKSAIEGWDEPRFKSLSRNSNYGASVNINIEADSGYSYGSCLFFVCEDRAEEDSRRRQ
ncbi:hypothetical protein PM082_012533 [Marasmius tenuissimus]|nr:hypothetical protein PM082_012533 [Marasmius tenuissimus]